MTLREDLGLAIGYDDPVGYDDPIAYSPPAVTDATLELYDAIGPALRHGDGAPLWPLLSWLDGAGSLSQLVRDVALPTARGRGWVDVLAPAKAPAGVLPWLAQFVGARLPAALPETDRRAAIAGLGSWRRGQRTQLLDAVRRLLTGGQRVVLHERTGLAGDGVDRPYRFVLDTYLAETPDPVAVAAQVAYATTAGGSGVHRVLEGATYNQIASEFPTVADAEAAFPTVDDMRFHLPSSEVL